MLVYRTHEGKEFDTSQFSSEEKTCFDWLLSQYNSVHHWMAFHSRVAQGVCNLTQKLYGTKWTEHPLNRIELDLMANVGIREGQLRGELSEMLVEK